MARTRKTPEGGDLVRFGVAIPKGLLKQFDAKLAEAKYASRSEALRDLVRAHLAEESWTGSRGEQTIVLPLVVDVRRPELIRKLGELRREAGEQMLTALQMRLNAREELQIWVLRGGGHTLRERVERIVGLRGLVMAKPVVAGPAET